MSEISFPAMQLTPRFVSVAILLVLTWLIAKFAQHMVKRATDGSKIVSGIAFWAIFLIMAPYTLNATGLNFAGVNTLQQFNGQIFSYWPLWMILSLLAAGIVFLFRGVPRLVSGAIETSRSDIQE